MVVSPHLMVWWSCGVADGDPVPFFDRFLSHSGSKPLDTSVSRARCTPLATNSFVSKGPRSGKPDAATAGVSDYTVPTVAESEPACIPWVVVVKRFSRWAEWLATPAKPTACPIRALCCANASACRGGGVDVGWLISARWWATWCSDGPCMHDWWGTACRALVGLAISAWLDAAHLSVSSRVGVHKSGYTLPPDGDTEGGCTAPQSMYKNSFVHCGPIRHVGTWSWHLGGCDAYDDKLQIRHCRLHHPRRLRGGGGRERRPAAPHHLPSSVAHRAGVSHECL